MLAQAQPGELTMSEIATELKVGEATLYRHLARDRQDAPELRGEQAA